MLIPSETLENFLLTHKPQTDNFLIKRFIQTNVETLIAKKIVFVSSVGSVKGDITAKHVVLEPGSTFSGKCSMVE